MELQFRLIHYNNRWLQLFDIYCCCICSFELLMMDGKTETCRAFYKNK